VKPSDLVAAKTHPAEYLLHKYWSRKPHNVISHLLGALDGDNGIVVDPFCGSGVVLREAAKLGIRSWGFDVNPVAALISSVTCSPPDVAEFQKEMSVLVNRFATLVRDHYSLDSRRTLTEGALVRYNVHEIVVVCDRCGTKVAYSDCKKKGRSYYCPRCSGHLRFNLENMMETKVVGVRPQNGPLIRSTDVLEREEHRSRAGDPADGYDYDMVENRRILAFEGVSTRDYFTNRNFSLLTHLAEWVHAISDPEIRNAALMLLTASVAQCSRLIPYRNNMTSGGPAWSVPGFWVPPRHIETNPLLHIQARMKKFERGLAALHARGIKAKVTVTCTSALAGLERLRSEGVKLTTVFLDPPYGDNVPYLEFSHLWNSFLKQVPNPTTDISVSDRENKEIAWSRYTEGLAIVLSKVKQVLHEEGKLLITFNNHDLQAWHALLSALQGSGFACSTVYYQIPAVISSKAQFSPKGSYVGDIYSVYRRAPKGHSPSESLDPIVSALARCAASRQGEVAKNLVMRTAMVSWLQHDVSVLMLSELNDLVDALFKEEDGNMLVWTGGDLPQEPTLTEIARETAHHILADGPKGWPDLYASISRKCLGIGIPDPGELREVLDGYVIFNGKNRCLATKELVPSNPTSLFDAP